MDMDGWVSRMFLKNLGDIDGFLGIVWMDNGRDLALSPGGPWSQEARSHRTTFPIVQHHPKMTARSAGSADSGSPEYTPFEAQNRPYTGHHAPQPLPIPQSATLLPLDYDSLLSMANLTKRAASDPLAALIPLFKHAAFSESQFLNLMQTLLKDEIGPIATQKWQQAASLDNLQYFVGVLERHVGQLRHSLRAIKSLGGLADCVKTTTTTGDQDIGTTHINHAKHKFRLFAFSVSSGPALIEDYTDLLDRCLELLARCNSGMNIMMNRSVVQESRKAMEQTDRVKKLTMLATFFIPLSFTASLFGMNFQVLGQGDLDIWLFFPVAIPLTILCYSFYVWNIGSSIEELTRWWDRTRKGTHTRSSRPSL